MGTVGFGFARLAHYGNPLRKGARQPCTLQTTLNPTKLEPWTLNAREANHKA